MPIDLAEVIMNTLKDEVNEKKIKEVILNSFVNKLESELSWGESTLANSINDKAKIIANELSKEYASNKELLFSLTDEQSKGYSPLAFERDTDLSIPECITFKELIKMHILDITLPTYGLKKTLKESGADSLVDIYRGEFYSDNLVSFRPSTTTSSTDDVFIEFRMQEDENLYSVAININRVEDNMYSTRFVIVRDSIHVGHDLLRVLSIIPAHGLLIDMSGIDISFT
ncbi:hypothetical protein JHD46_05360 [Sulfurimonas sp. SAG-AH-194-C20]|nr:hypothetical protein [Sulfurimonas sp. SAG-AH-194-C20]MDF1879067.1 hypothetical protein [Sulfurimonas sp. SAG-AH-194-C20]